MKLYEVKTIFISAILMTTALFGTSQIANGQGNSQKNKQKQQVQKQRQAEQKRNQRVRQREVQRVDERIRVDQRRQQTRIRNLPVRTANQENDRYRIMRNGSYYQTNNRGAELLRQAVRAGYQEGYRAGRNDRNGRRSNNYNNSSVYRRGNFGYQNYVNSGQYQYYFRQGFQRGYNDGYNSRNRYGNSNNGSLNILGSVLNLILTIERY